MARFAASKQQAHGFVGGQARLPQCGPHPAGNLTVYAFTTNMELGVLMHGGEMPEQIESKFGQLIDCGVLCQV